MREKNKQWMRDNKEKRFEYARKRREDKKEELAVKKREWDKANFEHRRSYRRQRMAYYTERAAHRRSQQKNATPPWLSEELQEAIKGVYWLAQDVQVTTGEAYHVDHIVPLVGLDVCGLHVPWNLQVIPADINLKKNRHFDGGW
jgi:hypothetical protein